MASSIQLISLLWTCLIQGQGKRKKLGLVRNFNILWKSQGRIPRNFIFKTKISGEARKKIVSMHELTQVPQKFSFIFDPILTSAVFNASKWSWITASHVQLTSFTSGPHRTLFILFKTGMNSIPISESFILFKYRNVSDIETE